MKIMVTVSSGPNDPTMATLGMLAAKEAAEQGHEVTVWLQGEAAFLANKQIYSNLQGVNMPAMKGVVEALLEKKVPLWVCKACGVGRDVGEHNWVATAVFKSMGDYITATLAADKTLDF